MKSHYEGEQLEHGHVPVDGGVAGRRLVLLIARAVPTRRAAPFLQADPVPRARGAPVPLCIAIRLFSNIKTQLELLFCFFFSFIIASN